MKTFNIFQCSEFPQFSSGKQIKHKAYEFDNLFGGNNYYSEINLVSRNYDGNAVYTEVSHYVNFDIAGEAFTQVGEGFQNVQFSSFLHKVEFPMYYKKENEIAILCVRKGVAKDFYVHYKNGKWFPELKLIQRKVDFSKLDPLIEQYTSVWFRGMQSGGLRSANLTGGDLKNHPHFIEYQETGGEISSVTVPFVFQGAEHKIMLSVDSGIVLQQKYDSSTLELEIVTAFTEEILKKVWADPVLAPGEKAVVAEQEARTENFVEELIEE